jgi:hypothetical protein
MPSASNAAETGGPMIVSSRISPGDRCSFRARSRQPRAAWRRLRRPAFGRGPPRPAWPADALPCWAVSGGSHDAGSSSTPISSSSSRSMVGPRPLDDSSHALAIATPADGRAEWYAVRSVTPMPRSHQAR